jgi:hypothetical protein
MWSFEVLSPLGGMAILWKLLTSLSGSEPTGWDGDICHFRVIVYNVLSPLGGMAIPCQCRVFLAHKCFRSEPTGWDGDYRVFPHLTTPRGTGSEPTVWDGDSAYKSLANSSFSVLNPPCGMVTT